MHITLFWFDNPNGLLARQCVIVDNIAICNTHAYISVNSPRMPTDTRAIRSSTTHMHHVAQDDKAKGTCTQRVERSAFINMIFSVAANFHLYSSATPFLQQYSHIHLSLSIFSLHWLMCFALRFSMVLLVHFWGYLHVSRLTIPRVFFISLNSVVFNSRAHAHSQSHW